MGNGCRMLLLNSPGGSTKQWGVGRGFLCSRHLLSCSLAERLKLVDYYMTLTIHNLIHHKHGSKKNS